MEPKGPGVPLVTYSAMLTRGVKDTTGCLADMDVGFGAATMIGRHNYATQETVNLLLTGRARSNVFNGTKSLGDAGSSDSVVLHGVEQQGVVGMLSLFENYGHVEVGSHLKDPKYPVWVVCSESHYSVIFSPVQGTQTLPTPKPVDLYYFDGLGRQDEVYKLTVDPNPDPPLDAAECTSDDNPPLNLCVRTKWKGAAVDWNGSEELL